MPPSNCCKAAPCSADPEVSGNVDKPDGTFSGDPTPSDASDNEYSDSDAASESESEAEPLSLAAAAACATADCAAPE